MDAWQRSSRINTLVQAAGYVDDPFLHAFGLHVNPTMVELCGRVLAPPSIQYYTPPQSPVPMAVTPTNGAWEISGQLLYQPAVCKSYALIALVHQREQPALQ